VFIRIFATRYQNTGQTSSHRIFHQVHQPTIAFLSFLTVRTCSEQRKNRNPALNTYWLMAALPVKLAACEKLM